MVPAVPWRAGPNDVAGRMAGHSPPLLYIVKPHVTILSSQTPRYYFIEPFALQVPCTDLADLMQVVLNG